MARPIPTAHRRRALLLPLVGLVILSGCAGGGDEEGMATARGVSRTFCQAFTDLATSSKGTAGDKGIPDPAVARRLERDARAVLEVVPDDAPGEVRDYFAALREMAELSQVWWNPATGGSRRSTSTTSRGWSASGSGTRPR